MIPTASPAWRLGWAVIATALAGCGAGRSGGQAAIAPADCPEPVSADEPSRFGSVFIDGRRVASNLAVRRTNAFPETYELVGPEPGELAALPVERIDLVQYLRGTDAETSYALCPGTVAILFATKPAGGS